MPSKSKKLTIGIPTYNNPHDFKLVLDSLFNQITHSLLDQIEILVSDNSENNLVEEILRTHFNNREIVYIKNTNNIGYDRNIDQILTKASGKFCWTLSSNDSLDPNNIQLIEKIFYTININPSTSHIFFDFMDTPIIRSGFYTQITNYQELLRLHDYRILGGLISHNIFNTDYLPKKRSDYYGNMWIHLSIIFKVTANKSFLIVKNPFQQLNNKCEWAKDGKTFISYGNLLQIVQNLPAYGYKKEIANVLENRMLRGLAKNVASSKLYGLKCTMGNAYRIIKLCRTNYIRVITPLIALFTPVFILQIVKKYKFKQENVPKRNTPLKTVILDTDDTRLLNNNVFNPEVANKVSHTLLPLCFLYREAKRQGINFITPDVYLNSPSNFPAPLLMTHLQTSFTNKLINLGVRPVILTCQESPFIATRFYTLLISYTKRFSHSIVFSGMRRFVSNRSVFHQMYFPQPYTLSDFSPKNFADKKMLVLVANAKSSKNLIKGIVIKILYGLSIKDIRHEREEIISYFSKNGILDLYGKGWNNLELSKSYKGTVPDKFATLMNYKFTLCLENAIFPGYVTEKIFDAMFAGSIPIYLGAPDIKNIIPSNAFIDLRDFKNYDELFSFINTMNEDKYNTYLEAIREFIQSDIYAKFSQKSFSESILAILNKEFNNL